jgi:hypothetical protein
VRENVVGGHITGNSESCLCVERENGRVPGDCEDVVTTHTLSTAVKDFLIFLPCE